MVFGAAAATGGVNLYAIAQIFAGPRAAGSFIGIQNGLGNVPGIAMPIITGLIIDWTGALRQRLHPHRGGVRGLGIVVDVRGPDHPPHSRSFIGLNCRRIDAGGSK